MQFGGNGTSPRLRRLNVAAPQFASGVHEADAGRRFPRERLRVLGEFTKDEWEILSRLNFGVLVDPRARIEWIL